MKRLFFTIVLASLVAGAYATINGSGYYRVRNYGSKRWASLVDDKAVVDKIAANVELHSLQLSLDTEATLSDPASVVYLYNLGGKRYDVAAQGTSLEALFDNSVFIGPNGSADGQTLYRIYGTYRNVTKYVADGELIKSEILGDATVNEVGEATFKDWIFLPVEANSDNYFGAVPTVTANGQSYCSLFTSFPYKPYSSGVKAYYIGRVGFGMAEMIEITTGVPSGSPVVIQCAGPKASDNKMQIIENLNALPSNSLNGVYFNYSKKSNVNHVAYDPKTMRVLGTTSDGSLGFITANLDYIPANTAYLKVPAGSSPEFKCVSSSEYEANLPLTPDQIFFDDSNVLQPQDDYTYSGTFYFPNSTNLKFQFYTASSLDVKDKIGAYSSDSKDVQINASSWNSYPFAYGSNYSWVIPTWKEGNIFITLNLQYQYVTFSSTAGIETPVVTEESPLRYIGHTIYSDKEGEIKVMNMAGQTLMTSQGNSLDISGLSEGIYIVTSGDKSLKIIR